MFDIKSLCGGAVAGKPASIRAMGLKDAAKNLMMNAGVPITPGYLGEDQSPKGLQAEADARSAIRC